MFGFFNKTVASVTAHFNKLVKDLEQIEKESIAKVNFHKTMQEIHNREQALAAKVAAKIRELIS